MCCDSRMSRCVAVGLVVLFSLLLAACGGGSSSGGGSTTSYTVTANAGAGGGISPASATVNSGATASFTITPDSSNSINTVTGCGGALSGSTYTTGAITADCAVTASFVSNGLPTVSVANASVAEGDSGTTSLSFTVTLSAPSSSNVTVDYATSDGSATAGIDYSATNGTLSIPAGSASGTVTVNVTGDTTVESDETLTLTLSNPTGATLGTATATGTINADDSAPALPTVSIADASVIEGDSGTTSLNFTVTLSALANGNVNVDFATSDSSATAGSDYTAISSTLTIPAASTSAMISVSVSGDTDIEGNETLTLTLSNSSGNATLGTVAATGTIFEDDVTGALNDTGSTTCSNFVNTALACPESGLPGQDAEYGRDLIANDDSDGHAGFSFIKLDASGVPLAASATNWACVKDNVTGLIWEVKTTDGSLRDMNHTYTWYNSTGISDGGVPGAANGGTCVDSSNCDTEKYVAAVNVAGLCGWSDWRLPTAEELLSLADAGALFASSVDSSYFPNTPFQSYWSSATVTTSSSSYYSSFAWSVGFLVGGSVTYSDKSRDIGARTVRGGP